MTVIVAGDPRKNPILLNTNKATGLLIQTDDGKPAVIFQMLSDGSGYIRYTKGEDTNFDQVARDLKLTN